MKPDIDPPPTYASIGCPVCERYDHTADKCPVVKMRESVRCLRLELPSAVWDDVYAKSEALIKLVAPRLHVEDPGEDITEPMPPLDKETRERLASEHGIHMPDWRPQFRRRDGTMEQKVRRLPHHAYEYGGFEVMADCGFCGHVESADIHKQMCGCKWGIHSASIHEIVRFHQGVNPWTIRDALLAQIREGETLAQAEADRG